MLAEDIGDAECVKRVQRGDTQSFEILVRRHQNTTFNLIYRFLGDYDEATETAQEVFLSAYKSIQQFRGDANFATWLYRIAFNHASSRRKSLNSKLQRQVRLEDDVVLVDCGADPETSGNGEKFNNACNKHSTASIVMTRKSFCSGIYKTFAMRTSPRRLMCPLAP